MLQRFRFLINFTVHENISPLKRISFTFSACSGADHYAHLGNRRRTNHLQPMRYLSP